MVVMFDTLLLQHDKEVLYKMGENSGVPILSVRNLSDTNSLCITWEDEDVQVYPYIWLRDNCPCRATCWSSNGLQINATSRSDLNLDVIPGSIDINGLKEGLDIMWSDGHKSHYESSWLRSHRFDSTDADAIFNPTLRYWGSDVKETQLKTFQFNDILSSDEVLYAWLLEIKELGITILKGAPLEKGQLQRIGERVQYLQWTNYGPTFQVQVRDNSIVNYKNSLLPLHTDLSYYTTLPAVMMLHCIRQCRGKGGENMLADGYKAAEELKNKHPDSFKVLTSTTLENFERGNGTYYYNEKFYSLARHPLIGLDERGEIANICYSPHARSSVLRCSVVQVEPVYRAIKAFNDILYKPDKLFKYKMADGDILCLNNRRTLHGRVAFEESKGSIGRHLEGAYIEWDPINSRMRILQEQLAKE